MSGKLAGRVAVVTGGRRGLGLAMALALGREGARLALADNESSADAVAQARALGIEAEGFTLDVASEQSVAAFAKAVAARFGHVHVLINAAGIAMRQRVEEISLADWQRTLDINLTGPFLMCRAMLPLMRGQGYGRIINMTSVMAHIASGDRPAYCASKTGLLGFTRSLALDLAADGICVMGISPGAFATDMTAALRSDVDKNAALMAITPMKRWGTAEEVGELALFLCSPGAGYLTGTDVVIDGGWLAQ